MEAACQSCPARYAVPDEKVRGRKVRIKCKRCGAPIIVDGTTSGASAAPSSTSATAKTPAPAPAASAPPAAKVTHHSQSVGARPTAAKPEAAAPFASGWREPGSGTPRPGVAGAAPRKSTVKKTMLGGLGGPGADAEPLPRAAPVATSRDPRVEPPRPASEPPPKPEAKPEPAPEPMRTAVAGAPGRRSAAKKTMLGIPAPAGGVTPAPVAAPRAEPSPAPEPEPEPALPAMSEIDAPAATPGERQAAEWTVAITDDQHEELTTNEVIELYARGAIDAETFMWADGMDDWKQPWEIPLIAMQLEARGLRAPSANDDFDDDHTVVADSPASSSRLPSGVWREPGSWADEGDDPLDDAVGFDDMTVSMDAARTAEVLRAAGMLEQPDEDETIQDDAGPGGADTMSVGVDELLDDARHDDVTKAIASPLSSRSPMVQEPAPEPEHDPHALTGARGEDSVLFSLDALSAESARTAQPMDDEPVTTLFDASSGVPAPTPLGVAPYGDPGAPLSPEAFAPPPPSAELAPPAAFAPAPPAPTAAKKGGRGGLFVLLFLLLLLAAAGAAAFYFRQPAALFDRLQLP